MTFNKPFRFIALFACFGYLLAWDEDPGRVPTKCETCKLLSIELNSALKALNSHEYLETKWKANEDFVKRSTKKYQESELRLIEAMTVACRNLLEYHVHSKRPGSLRFSKDEHPTMKTFKEIRREGGRVDIGVPEDVWDVPGIEIMRLKRSCDTMVELYEEDIEDWFFHHQNVPFSKYFCEGIILKNDSKRNPIKLFSSNNTLSVLNAINLRYYWHLVAFNKADKGCLYEKETAYKKEEL